MSRRLAPALALALALLATSAGAHALEPFTAQYTASYKGMSAGGAMKLGRAGDRWTYSMGMQNALAQISQATVFTESGNRYRPVGGSDRSTYLGQTRAVVARYDWNAMQARWSGDVKPSRAGPAPLQPGDMDALLVNLALVRDVEAGRVEMKYRLVENGRAKPLHYRIAGREKVDVGGRMLDATRVAHTAGGKQTTAWVAAGVPVPVRIVQSEGGRETFRLQLTSWQ